MYKDLVLSTQLTKPNFCTVSIFYMVILVTLSNKNIDVQGLVPERPISANPGLKFCSTFCIYVPSYALLRVTFCVIITVSQS